MLSKVSKVLNILYKILMIPLGVLVGGVVGFMILRIAQCDAPVYLTMGFIITVPLATTQLWCLMLLFFFFARSLKLPFLFSAFNNFIISFIVTILYHVSFFFPILSHTYNVAIADNLISPLDEIIIWFLIVPMLIFILVIAVFIWLSSRFRKRQAE